MVIAWLTVDDLNTNDITKHVMCNLDKYICITAKCLLTNTKKEKYKTKWKPTLNVLYKWDSLRYTTKKKPINELKAPI